MDVVDKLFDAARAASLAGAGDLELTADEVAQLLTSPVIQLRLRREFARLNDPDVRDLVLAYLALAADRLEEEAKQAEDAIEGIEWTLGYGAKITSIVGGGALIAAVVAGTGVLGAAVILCAGGASLAFVGWRRHRLKSELRKAKAAAERMRRLVTEVRQ